jgi:hypothetical protein
MHFTRLVLTACLLFGAACSSEEPAEKTAKTAEAKEGKKSLLISQKGDVAIVEVIDQIATKAGYEIFIEADVAGTLTPKDQNEINGLYGAKEDYKGALHDLAKRAKCKAVEEKSGDKIAFRFVKE